MLYLLLSNNRTQVGIDFSNISSVFMYFRFLIELFQHLSIVLYGLHAFYFRNLDTFNFFTLLAYSILSHRDFNLLSKVVLLSYSLRRCTFHLFQTSCCSWRFCFFIRDRKLIACRATIVLAIPHFSNE